MRTPRFYCPELDSTRDIVDLPMAAHRHAVQVLRMKQGESLLIFNGLGLEYEAVLDQISKKSSSVQLGNRIETNNESSIEITLIQGISRGERMDYAVQKAVELGVTRIIPVISGRCNVQLSHGRSEKKWAHWHGIMVSACEQSGRNILPELCHVVTLDQALELDTVDCRLILDPSAEKGFTEIGQQNKIVLLIGPEGGLSEDEVQQAHVAGFQSVKFGPRILRTETAAVAALAAVQTLWGDLG